MKKKAALSVAGEERRVGLTNQSTYNILPASTSSHATAFPRLVTSEWSARDAAVFATALHGNADGCLVRFAKASAWKFPHRVPAEDAGRWAHDYAGQDDVFIELNSKRRGPGHPTAGIRTLHADLDFYKLPDLKEWPPEAVLAVADAALETAGIPKPQLATFTGRGVQLVWLVTPTKLIAEPKARYAMDMLVRLLKPLGADPACVDRPRVFRLPGTVNTKSGKLARLLRGEAEPDRYNLDVLCRAILPPKAQGQKGLRPRRYAKRPGDKRTVSAVVCHRRLADLDKLIMGRWGGKVPEGWRNIVVHLAAVHFAQLPGDPEANTLAWASRWTDGHDEDETRRTVRHILRKRVARNGSQHRYTSAKMGKVLGVSVDEVLRFDLRSIYAETDTLADATQRRRDRDVEKKRRQRREAGARSQAESARKKKPWVAYGTSRSTYYAHLAKGLLVVETKAEQPGRTISAHIHSESCAAAEEQGRAEGRLHVVLKAVEEGAAASAKARHLVEVEKEDPQKSAAPKIGYG